MHTVKPGMKVEIRTVEIAVRADAQPGEADDEISALLTENGIANENSLIVDWRYMGLPQEAQAPQEEIEEGEIFEFPRE